MKSFLIAPLLLMALALHAQNTNKENHQNINTQVWEPFMAHFKAMDIENFMAVHSSDLVRVPADQDTLMNYSDCRSDYQGMFNYYAKQNSNFELDLRFIERITNGKMASERGIYKFTDNPGSPNASNYYGKFHVILRQEGGVWKILVDYDSNENQSIGEDDYLKAKAMDDYNTF